MTNVWTSIPHQKRRRMHCPPSRWQRWHSSCRLIRQPVAMPPPFTPLPGAKWTLLSSFLGASDLKMVKAVCSAILTQSIHLVSRALETTADATAPRTVGSVRRLPGWTVEAMIVIEPIFRFRSRAAGHFTARLDLRTGGLRLSRSLRPRASPRPCVKRKATHNFFRSHLLEMAAAAQRMGGSARCLSWFDGGLQACALIPSCLWLKVVCSLAHLNPE